MAKTFLKAEWQKLAMANYAVDKKLLEPFLPHGTEIDEWNGQCFVSLVGFMFLKTLIKGIRVPFHSNFEEVNLRFYVRYNDLGTWKRGVVFINEIVPRPALMLVANIVYGENYSWMRMKHAWTTGKTEQTIEYQWKKGSWNIFSVTTGLQMSDIKEGSEEEFITEHYWGYTKLSATQTSEYGVEHPRWQVYSTLSYKIEVNFRNLYGEAFGFLKDEKPVSVFLAEGSEIFVKRGRRI